MYVMIWAEDSGFKIQRRMGIGSTESPYLGVSLPLALTAVKYDMPRVLVLQRAEKDTILIGMP